jgi:hypothetical protein
MGLLRGNQNRAWLVGIIGLGKGDSYKLTVRSSKSIDQKLWFQGHHTISANDVAVDGF